ncbi:hypothetical protein MRB53_030421 [Persea americana]|uniref:Uncharacterized protein n=1 Tax=Persea americana TaxID=3435 RepID=A0ACC2KLJ5_PERAE|nr:hypothetical protein MRB53_030421 [Persea americana]
MGGWDPSSWDLVRHVFVYDFMKREWRQGRDMPTAQSFFMTGVVDDRWVVVVGGHNDNKNALKTTSSSGCDEEVVENRGFLGGREVPEGAGEGGEEREGGVLVRGGDGGRLGRRQDGRPGTGDQFSVPSGDSWVIPGGFTERGAKW